MNDHHSFKSGEKQKLKDLIFFGTSRSQKTSFRIVLTKEMMCNEWNEAAPVAINLLIQFCLLTVIPGCPHCDVAGVSRGAQPISVKWKNKTKIWSSPGGPQEDPKGIHSALLVCVMSCEMIITEANHMLFSVSNRQPPHEGASQPVGWMREASLLRVGAG